MFSEKALRGQRRNGLSKNTLLDNRFSARTLRRSFGAPPIRNWGSQTFMLGTPFILYVGILYVLFSPPRTADFLDEGQITHLICARLKYDLYDFFRGCF